MASDKAPLLIRIKDAFLRLFWDRRFAHYSITGIIISVINVFFLWLLIDVLGMATVAAGFLVVGITFLFRYILLVFFKIF